MGIFKKKNAQQDDMYDSYYGSEDGKRTEESDGAKKSSSVLGVVICLLIALVAFFSLLLIEKVVIEDVPYATVVVAKQEVPGGLYIDSKNVGEYFYITERVASDVPAEAVYSIEMLQGQYVTNGLKQNEIAVSSDFMAMDFYEGLDEPMEISIGVSNIAQVVGGILRAGDLIDISILIESENDMNNGSFMTTEAGGVITVTSNSVSSVETTEQESVEDADIVTGDDTIALQEDADIDDEVSEEIEAEPLLPYTKHEIYTYEDIRVTKVFTSTGLEITADMDMVNSDSVNSALVINVAIPSSLAEELNRGLIDGMVRISRVVEENTELSEVAD